MQPIRGTCHKFGHDIDTDAIIPARYLNTSDPLELARHCMEDADPEFPGRVKAGDIIVAGKNFGCGSSREHAPLAIKAAGVAAVIAASFARIFYRNAINIGLPIFEAPEAAAGIEGGDEVLIEPDKGLITNLTKNETYRMVPLPPFMQELMDAGGLMAYVARKVKDRV
ncbi:MAG TPA: 3-isopropylmalate dehydratase small subunit [Peptococcaceae bacterium]|nr:MAG: 3-isopropylmalate dehydratase small subunit [Moorella sp. 60_41]HBT46456.1 3-isopropylmalate dehydratase small subunit [Peptococcaceae bacterium]